MSRKSRKSRLGNFRSEFEQTVNTQLNRVGFDYESEKIQYHIPRVYTPDFVHPSGILVECKGFFREGDTQKYKSIVNCLPDDKELVFVLMKPNQKVRKGTKLSMGEWCDKHGIKWYNIDTLVELIDYANSRGN
jgi:hypothetical protein